jgi:hypothetical protein
MTITYEEFLRDREVMPVFDESIFYPERELYKLGMNDEDIECLVQFFKWHLEQRNRRLDRQRIIKLLKLRMEKLIRRKELELVRELEELRKFSE